MMSPLSSNDVSEEMTESVGPPACTNMMILRGLLRDWTNSSKVAWPTRPPGVSGLSATKDSIFDVVRLKTEMRKP